MIKSQRNILSNGPEADNWRFKIEFIEYGKSHENDLFLLSHNGEEFMIYKSDLKKTARKFPDSVKYGYNNRLRSFVSIPASVCQRIMGEHLKPMDTDCLESEF
ncbi:MAG: hypothetical protein GTN36_04575 [Candidatus Aenigmarchaeota archaeon]|nr:hypothetical protein [Candidatus Aenigmarchaeota archaeon]